MATISVRLDDAVKTQLDDFCHGVGLNTSTIMKMFAAKVVREQRIPFVIDMDPFYSAENMAQLNEGIADHRAGRNWHEHELIEIDE